VFLSPDINVNNFYDEQCLQKMYNIKLVYNIDLDWKSCMSTIVKYLSVFFISMLPVFELRGAVPWGVANDLPLTAVLVISIVGNMVPVPFIILFIRQIFSWMKKKSSWLRSIAEKLEKKGHEKGGVLVKYETLGLFILVAIPLPGTGAWTGALVAALFDLRMKNALPAIFLGVVAAGIIMTLLSYGIDALI